MNLRLLWDSRKWEETSKRGVLSQKVRKMFVCLFVFINLNSFQTVVNAKGKEWNSTEKLGEEYVTFKF